MTRRKYLNFNHYHLSSQHTLMMPLIAHPCAFCFLDKVVPVFVSICLYGFVYHINNLLNTIKISFFSLRCIFFLSIGNQNFLSQIKHEMTAENLLKKYDYLVSVKLAKESFKITKGRNCSSIFGSIEIICSDELPSYLQIHLLGEEKVGNKTNYILDDIYQLTTIQWIQHEENKFELPFELSIPNDIPSSIQFNQLDGVYYYLKINVANKTITQPIHLHHTSSLLNNEKVYWGIVNQPEVKWQYEIEFPNIYNFVNTNNQLCIRFKSMSQQKPQQFADCCLLGFQIIQSIQREG